MPGAADHDAEGPDCLPGSPRAGQVPRLELSAMCQGVLLSDEDCGVTVKAAGASKRGRAPSPNRIPSQDVVDFDSDEPEWEPEQVWRYAAVLRDVSCWCPRIWPRCSMRGQVPAPHTVATDGCDEGRSRGRRRTASPQLNAAGSCVTPRFGGGTASPVAGASRYPLAGCACALLFPISLRVCICMCVSLCRCAGGVACRGQSACAGNGYPPGSSLLGVLPSCARVSAARPASVQRFASRERPPSPRCAAASATQRVPCVRCAVAQHHRTARC
jgi:hypothetical protein